MKHSGIKYHLTIALQVVIALVAIAMYLSLYNFSERTVIEQNKEKTLHDIDRLRLTIDTELREAETATRGFANMVFKNGHKIPHDTAVIYAALEQFLIVLPEKVTGVVVGFEDKVFPEYAQSNGLIPLVRRVNGELKRYQVGEKRDVRRYNNWYRETKETESVRWSKPFLSEDGKIICSFCLPLFSCDDTFAGVVAIDFSLDHLSRELIDYKPFPTSTISIIDQGFTYLASSEDSTLVLHETVYSVLSKRGFAVDTTIVNNVKACRDNHYHIEQGTYKNPFESYFYHACIPNTGWTILVTCPAADMSETLRAIRLRMLYIGFTICLLIIVVALSFMKYK